jgi:hypothetical protein
LADPKQGGMNPNTVKKIQPGQSDVNMFARLPLEVQRSLAKDMDQKEFNKYVMINSRIPLKARAQMRQER